MEELCKIQSELRAPKGQYNTFGKFQYRSCEDILEAVKPLLRSHNCTLNLRDEIAQIGDRYYVKATATLTNGDGATEISTAFAREEEKKAGMDGAQITGSASSYARKYALNGLFCIDDTKDADTDEQRTEREARAPKQKAAAANAAPDPIATAQPITPASKNRITMDMLEDQVKCDCLLKWAYGFWTASSYDPTFDAGARLCESYDATAEVVERFTALFESYKLAKTKAK